MLAVPVTDPVTASVLRLRVPFPLPLLSSTYQASLYTFVAGGSAVLA